MATKAFQKIYTKITQITKATCSLKATGVGYDELATVNGKLAQVVKIAGDEVTLQVFEGTEGRGSILGQGSYNQSERAACRTLLQRLWRPHRRWSGH